MIFANRIQAGRLLADALAGRLADAAGHPCENVVVFGLPRGGVVVAAEVAAILGAPLDVVVARKIGHPSLPEFAIAAVNEDGGFHGSSAAIAALAPEWLEEAKTREWLEARRQHESYTSRRAAISVRGMTAIVIDDGIATGLTMRAAIEAVRSRGPSAIVAAAPVVPRSNDEGLEGVVDQLVALVVPDDESFMGSVGAYYEDFGPVSEDAVFRIVNRAATLPRAVMPAA